MPPQDQAVKKGGTDPQKALPPALEEVLIAFQKALGRARKSAMQYAQAELGFQVGGMQEVFGVGKMTVKLRGALSLQSATDKDAEGDRIGVDFAADPAQFSEIELAITPQPMQEVENGVVIVREGDTAADNVYHFRAYVLQNGRPVPGVPVSVRVQRGDSSETFAKSTDITGCCRIEVKLNEKSYDLALQGERFPRTKAEGASVYLVLDAGSAGVSRPVEVVPEAALE